MKTIHALLCLVLVAVGHLCADPIRVLLITGQSNHRWEETTPLIKTFLEKSGDITVTVHEHPEKLTATDLSKIDVIVSNWNAYGQETKIKQWPEITRQAFTQFVSKGGGHVGIHAGTSSFSDWEDYQAIALMTWKAKKTSHGRQHTFAIRIDKQEHPAIKGWKPEPLFDELWKSIEMHPKATVLASSFSALHDGGTQTWEPCVLVGQFGQGRCFTTTLGHSAKSLEQADAQQIIIQGVQWAAKKR